MTTHNELVDAAHNWLWLSQRHAVVMSECESAFVEIPDVIGWRKSGASTLVECKTSRDDFRADRTKPFRRYPSLGMGYERWFFVPKGLLDPRDLPDGWGLAELRGSRVFKVKKPTPFIEHNVLRETVLLVSAVSRLQRGFGTRVFGNEQYPFRVSSGDVVIAEWARVLMGDARESAA